MLKCEHLVKKYIQVTALDDLTTEIEPGKIIELLGPNGSGKSTLMKTIAGLTRPTSGSITFNGEPLNYRHKAMIAYMPTEPFYFNYMTAKDVGKYYKDFFPDFDEAKFYRLLTEMDLNGDMKAKSMSSGMMAKLKIAATLSRNSKLIMLDEPLNGIDIIAREKIIKAIREYKHKDSALLVSSHLVDELEEIIDSAIFLKRGKCVLQGPANELRNDNQKTIVDLYKEIYADISY